MLDRACRVRWGARIGAALLLAVSPAAAEESTQPSVFRLKLAGMLGFVPTTDGGLEVLLINELDQPVDVDHEVTHFPQLALRCEDLPEGSQDRADCAYWPPTFDRSAQLLSLHGGFLLHLKVGGADQNGSVRANHTFDKRVVDLADVLAKVSPDKPDAAILSKEVWDPETARDHAIVRVVLNGGTIHADLSSTGSFKFKHGASAPFPMAEVADVIVWEIPYQPSQGVIVALEPLDATLASPRQLTLRSAGNLELSLLNEPDLFEFCAHAPDDSEEPFAHFLGFYDLTKLVVADESELDLLPLPFADDATLQCTKQAMQTAAAGLRVNCMPVMYGGKE